MMKDEHLYHKPVSPALLVEYLCAHRITLSAAESCTGGRISAAITSVSGCSAVFLGGACTYANQMKMDALGVLPATLAQHGAVSAETALEMARGIRRLAGSQLAIATTGIAGPGGGSAEKPVGLVYFAVVSPTDEHVEYRLFSAEQQTDSRAAIQQQATDHALRLLLQAAKKIGG